MRAIVCDSCGKVILLPGRSGSYGAETGVFQLIGDTAVELDLCEECAAKLMETVRNHEQENL